MDQHAAPGGEISVQAPLEGHAAAPGTACYNCGTELCGPWCHKCGQAATDYHRHAHHLVFEAIEGLSHADGRLLRTLPRLVRDPAGLTRDYLAGKRASQIPPMRLVLVTLLIVFLAGGWAGRSSNLDVAHTPSEADKAELKKADIGLHMEGMPTIVNTDVTEWLRVHVTRAINNPERLIDVMHEKAHDFAFLMLPISAFLLALIFVFRPGFVLFDHFIFSMHSLSFQGLLLSLFLVTDHVVPGAGFLVWASPLHLFVHMRGVYGTGTWGTLVRMAVLFCLSAMAFSLLLATLIIVGLQALRA
jgi:hypothetical protein